MGAFAIIPAAPVLLEDIDRVETARVAELRALIRETLRTQTCWSLPVGALPPLVGLGGWGIDRGVDTRTGRTLTGHDWVEAVESLTPTERTDAEAVDPSVIVGLLHAHAAGVEVGPLGSSPNLLLPIDLSAAATEDAPLAPVDGAADFDAELVDALTASAGVDVDRVFDLCARSADVHANLAGLEVGLRHILERGGTTSAATLSVDEHVHEVRSLCATGAWA